MTEKKPIPLHFKLIYGSGEWNAAITATARSLFLNYFLVTVVGMTPRLVGRLILIGRVWDAVNDPLVGILSDRLDTRWGRRRPLMLFAAIPLCVTFALLWTRPDTGSQAMLFLYFLVISLLLDTMLTVFSVPHTALLAELTDDYGQRITYTVWRNGFFLAGALVVAALFRVVAEDWMALVGETPNVFRGYVLAGWFFGLSMLVSPILIFFTVREPESVTRPALLNPLKIFRTVYANKPFRSLSTGYFFAFAGMEFIIVTFVWYLQIVIRVPEALEPFMPGVLLLASILVLPGANLMLKRLGKKRGYYLSALALAATIPLYAVFPPGNMGFFIPFCVWLGVVYGTGITVPWTMLPDVIEYDELETGERREGIYAAYMVFFRKLGSGVASWVVNLVLASVGFVEGTYGTDVEQSRQVVLALRLLAGVVPVFLALASIFAIRPYPITSDYHEDLKRALQERSSDPNG